MASLSRGRDFSSALSRSTVTRRSWIGASGGSDSSSQATPSAVPRTNPLRIQVDGRGSEARNRTWILEPGRLDRTSRAAWSGAWASMGRPVSGEWGIDAAAQRAASGSLNPHRAEKSPAGKAPKADKAGKAGTKAAAKSSR